MNSHTKYRKNSLRLRTWDYFLPGPYFFTICTHKRKEIFGNVSIRTEIMKIFKSVSLLKGILVHAIIIAVEHIHEVIALPEGRKISLPRYIGMVKVKVTQMIREKGEQAHPYAIWQRSYYDHIIRNEQDFDEKARYIENHPFKEEGNILAEWH